MPSPGVRWTAVEVVAVVGSTVTVGTPNEFGTLTLLQLSPPHVQPHFIPDVGTQARLLMVGRVPFLYPDSIAQDAITAREIIAGAITALLVQGDTIIAGAPLGANVTIKGDGVRVYALDVDLAQYEASRWATGLDDFWSITNAAGEALASVSSLGAANFSSLTSVAWPTIGAADWTGVGGTLDEILDRRPRGIVKHVQAAYPTTFAGTSAEIGAFEFGAQILPGRAYLLTGRCRVKSTVAGDTAELRVRYTAAPLGAVKPLVTSNPLAISASDVGTLAKALRIETVFDAFNSVPSEFRFLLTYSRIAGTGLVSLDPQPYEPIDLVVTDIGPTQTFSGITLSTGSGGEVTPPTVQRTLIVDGLWANVYRGDGAHTTTETVLRQGTPSLLGARKTILGFRELTELVGATIQSVTLRLDAKTWKLSSGGEAMVGFHNKLVQPTGTLVGMTGITADLLRSPWTGLGVGFVDLTALAPQEWATGVKRGIYLGVAQGIVDGNDAIVGTFSGVADPDLSVRPQLTVTYTV